MTASLGAATPRATSHPIALVVLILFVLTACSGLPGAGGGASGGIKDFSMVAYQGEDLLGGKEVKFSQVFQQKKPVVLNFWAGQCPPCRAEMPEFQTVADDFAGKVVFVGIDVGPFTGLGNHDDAQRLLSDLGIHYPAAYAVDASPMQPYGVRVMPTTVFLSADGKIVKTTNGALREPQLRAELEQLVTS
jgi:thiol-disulfide isomerase/thioredoxin